MLLLALEAKGKKRNKQKNSQCFSFTKQIEIILFAHARAVSPLKPSVTRKSLTIFKLFYKKRIFKMPSIPHTKRQS